MAPITTFLALKIESNEGKDILVRRFRASKVWSMPIITLTNSTDDPYVHLPKVLKEVIVSPKFKFISAVPIVKYDHTERIYDDKERAYCPKIFRSFIYRLQFEGNVSPVLPGIVRDDYDRSRFAPINGLRALGHVNRALDAFLQAVEKEPNLK